MEKKGDSTKSLFKNVQRCSSLCSVLKEDLKDTDLERKLCEDSPSVLSLKRRRDKLMENLVEIETDQLKLCDSSTDSSNEIQPLMEANVSESKSQLSQNLRLLECLQCGKDLRSTLFPSSQSIDSSHAQSTVKPLILKQVNLVETLLKECMKLKFLKDELESVKKERLQCMEEGREMAAMLENLKSEVHSSDTQNSPELAEMKEKVALLSRALQSLIVGSKVNWSSDPNLLELTTQLAKDTY